MYMAAGDKKLMGNLYFSIAYSHPSAATSKSARAQF
jgi:hypothetical protein